MRAPSLAVAVLLEVIASAAAADTTFPAARFTGPTRAAPYPPTVTNSYRAQPTKEYTKEHTQEYYTKEHTKEYTKEWVETKTYAQPHTYTKEYTKEWVETKTYAQPHTYTKSHKPYPTVLSLEDALINAGCSKFLAFIKSDDDTWALYNSPRVRTVFAPDDASFDSNATFHARARLRRRELTPEEQQQADLSAESQLTDLSKLRIVPGTVVETNDNSANLLGGAQVVVSEVNSTTGAVKIASGLGDEVDVKTTDIEYAGGLIHTTSGLLTNPVVLTTTLAELGNPSLSSFNSLLAGLGASNLTKRTSEKIDFTPRVTVFIPTNDAIKAAGGITPSQAAAFLEGHTVVSPSLAIPVGYLPELKNGQVIKTEGGGSAAISLKDGATFIGQAKIVQANIILPNGVAHVVDKVLAQPVHTAAAVPGTVPGAGRAALVAAGVVAMALPSW